MSALIGGLLLHAPSYAMSYHEAFPARQTDQSDGQKILDRLDYQRGSIKMPGAPATLNIPSNFNFLNAADARTVLVDLWGNPPRAADNVLGMIFPSRYDPLDDHSWSSVVQYNADGYVSDKDAQTIDYSELLEQLKTATSESNSERRKQGFEPIRLAGWASPPFYDIKNHTLHWARDLIFGEGGHEAHVLNYSARILGREGVFQFNFVAGLDQLDEIKSAIPSVTKLVTFDKNKHYEDYAEGDKVAAYGMAGMIAAGAGAKLVAKAGIAAVALGFLKKGALLVVLAAGAVMRFFQGLFSRNKTPTD